MSTPLPMAYVITDNNYAALNYIPFTEGMTSYCANLTRPSSGENDVFIITVSQTALPSIPKEVNISGKRIIVDIAAEVINFKLRSRSFTYAQRYRSKEWQYSLNTIY